CRYILYLVVLAVTTSFSAPSGADVILTAAEADRMSRDGEAVLVDIRGPDEWRRTGVAASAATVSIHEPDFLRKLDEATGGDRDRPVALICATGGRSSAILPQLRQIGFSRVMDVAEGMIGGQAGPGWIAAGLPLKPYREE